MHSPFSVIARVRPGTKERYWYAKFWNEERGRYSRWRSLEIPFAGRRGGRDLATEAAKALLEEVDRDSDPLVLDFVAAFWAPG